MDSKLWFNKQRIKNKFKKSVDNNSQIKNIKNKTEEESNKMMKEQKKILRVSVDAGKGYTKWVYKIVKESTDNEGKTVKKLVWKTRIDMSTIEKGEADYGETVYIKNEGDEAFEPYNFNIRTKAVELKDKSKNTDEHKALMQRALFKVAKEEGITDFEVIMCISLDQFKLKENIEEMQKNMSVGSFEYKVDGETTKINIHKLVIEPEAIVATRYAKKTKLKDSSVVLVDIGTLNVGIAAIDRGKLIKEDLTAPRKGYDTMIDMFKEFSDSKKFDCKKGTLEIYVDKHQGSEPDLDEVFKEFFAKQYAPIIKKEINDKGFGKFSELIFMGGTSIKCKDLIEENFKEYAGVEVITDIYATAKGAYEKGCKDLDKMDI